MAVDTKSMWETHKRFQKRIKEIAQELEDIAERFENLPAIISRSSGKEREKLRAEYAQLKARHDTLTAELEAAEHQRDSVYLQIHRVEYEDALEAYERCRKERFLPARRKVDEAASALRKGLTALRNSEGGWTVEKAKKRGDLELALKKAEVEVSIADAAVMEKKRDRNAAKYALRDVEQELAARGSSVV